MAEPLPSRWVMFDSNVYQHLSDLELAKISAREMELSIRAVANRYVMEELFYRLVIPGKRPVGVFVKSLRRLVGHCLRDKVLMTGPTRDELVAQLIFGIVAGEDQEQDHRVAAVICTERHISDWPEDVKAWLQKLVARMDATERDFLRHNAELLARANGVRSTTLRNATNAEMVAAFASEEGKQRALHFIALGTVEAYALRHALELSPEQLQKCVELAGHVFRAAFGFERHMRTRALLTGYDLGSDRNVNDLWDWLILSSAVDDGTIGQVPVVFVTMEKQLLDSAIDAGSSVVVHLTEYLSQIGLRDLRLSSSP